MAWCADGAQGQARAQITAPIDDGVRTILPKSKPAFLRGAVDEGPLTPDRSLDRMVLVMKMGDTQAQGLRALLESQQTRGSKNYHAWLTPEEYGRRFGPAPEDLAKVEAWLQGKGFRVEGVSKGGQWIRFAGTAGQVNAAFHTTMHRYGVGGETHLANATDVSIPSAMAAVVAGIPLHDVFSKPLFVPRRSSTAAMPEITAPWNPQITALVPGDFATIYDLGPVYKAGATGSGQTIAILGESDVNATDVTTFQTIFGVASNQPKVIDIDVDPGVDTQFGYGTEATLDTEWASAIAPGAAIDLVVSEPTGTIDPIAYAGMYVVDGNLAQIISASYGECEQDLGSAGNALWNSLWQEAAAQGISVVVASGDQGSVACNSNGLDLSTGYGPMAVNGLASTPFDTAVGGTEFHEILNGGTLSTYWNTTNTANLASVKGYIPEMVWNDSCDDLNNVYEAQECSSTLPTLAASGGGVSTVYPTPVWQTLNVPGLQALSSYNLPSPGGGSPRGVPDVAMASSNGHDGYLFCFTTDTTKPDCQLSGGAVTQTTFQNEAGGTSFATPAFAGILALLNQQEKSAEPQSASADGRQGLANYTLYALAAAENYSNCDSNSRTDPTQGAPAGCTFNDITFGNNGPPQTYTFMQGVTGLSATTGYDLTTGLGSVDAQNLVSNWTSAVAGFHGSQSNLTANNGTAALTVQHGQAVIFSVDVQKLSGDATTQSPNGSVSLVGQGGTLAGAAGVANASLTGIGGGTSSTGPFAVNNLPGGSYSVTASFPGDGYFAPSASAPIAVTVSPEGSVTTLKAYTYASLGYGGPALLVAQVAGSSGYGTPTGKVTFFDGATELIQLPLNGAGMAQLNNCPTGTYYPPWPNLPCFSVGTHKFSATYSGDTSFNASPTPAAASQVATATIPKGNLSFLTLALKPANTSGIINTPYSLVASVPTSPNAATATGTVQFSVNSTVLGTAAFSGNPAEAVFTNVQLPQGTTTLSASYSGDGNYNPIATSSQAQIGIPIGWVAQTTAQTVNPGQTATFSLTLSNATYSGPLPLSCVSGTDIFQPTPPPVGVVCSVSPTTVTMTANGQQVPVTVTITTTTSTRNDTDPRRGMPWSLPPVVALTAWCLRRRRWSDLLRGLAASAVLVGLMSCGGSSQTVTGPPPPPPTSAVFSVVAPISTTSGGSTSTSYFPVQLTLNVNQ